MSYGGLSANEMAESFFSFFSVGNNNILEHSDAFAHLLGCHLETDLERKLQDLAHGK